MDLHLIKKNAILYGKKYAYLLLLPAIGIILMTLPQKAEDTAENVILAAESVQQMSTQEQLEEILSHVAGAGRVKVMLTVSAGERTRYQTDSDTVNSGEGGTVSVDTVIVTDRERGQAGLITQVDPPQYLGAVIVCEGGDSATVRLAITEAVSDATGLPSDKITVLKMK